MEKPFFMDNFAFLQPFLTRHTYIAYSLSVLSKSIATTLSPQLLLDFFQEYLLRNGFAPSYLCIKERTRFLLDSLKLLRCIPSTDACIAGSFPLAWYLQTQTSASFIPTDIDVFISKRTTFETIIFNLRQAYSRHSRQSLIYTTSSESNYTNNMSGTLLRKQQVLKHLSTRWLGKTDWDQILEKRDMRTNLYRIKRVYSSRLEPVCAAHSWGDFFQSPEYRLNIIQINQEVDQPIQITKAFDMVHCAVSLSLHDDVPRLHMSSKTLHAILTRTITLQCAFRQVVYASTRKSTHVQLTRIRKYEKRGFHLPCNKLLQLPVSSTTEGSLDANQTDLIYSDPFYFEV